MSRILFQMGFLIAFLFSANAWSKGHGGKHGYGGMDTKNFGVNFYGDFRLSVGQFDRTDNTGNSVKTVEANNTASRIGFKGEVGKGEWKGIYNYQLGAVNDAGGSGTTSRFFWAGVKNKKYGKAIYGRLSPAYKLKGKLVDPFYDTSAGTLNGANNFGLSAVTRGFTNNAIVYYSPKWHGVSFNLGTFLGDTTSNSADYDFGLTYNHPHFEVGVQHLVVNAGASVANSTAEDKNTRVHFKYWRDKWTLGTSYETFDKASGNNDTYLYVAGTYEICPGMKAAVSYGQVGDTGSTASDGTGYTVAVFKELLESTEYHLLYSNVDFDDNSSDSRAVIGISHKFGGKIN